MNEHQNTRMSGPNENSPKEIISVYVLAAGSHRESASIQPRRSPVMFARSPRISDPPGSSLSGRDTYVEQLVKDNLERATWKVNEKKPSPTFFFGFFT